MDGGYDCLDSFFKMFQSGDNQRFLWLKNLEVQKESGIFITAIRVSRFSSTRGMVNYRCSRLFKGCSPLQLFNGLIGLKPAIVYFAYTYRYGQG